MAAKRGPPAEAEEKATTTTRTTTTTLTIASTTTLTKRRRKTTTTSKTTAKEEEEEEEDAQQQHQHQQQRRQKKKRDVSVLMPIRNARPHLSSAALSLLSQVECTLELVFVDDASTDGSYETMCEFKRAYERLDKGEGGDEATCVGRWKEDDEVNPIEADARLRDELETNGCESMVRKYCKGGRHAVIVKKLERKEELRSGQGLALNVAYALSTCEYVAEMEADDIRPQNCFSKLLAALKANASLDAAFSKIALIGDLPSNDAQEGWVGMKRFEEWQNSLETGEDMRNGRFLEIPAMRASGCYRRSFLEEKLNLVAQKEREKKDARIYEDLWMKGGKVVDCAVSDEQETNLNRNPNHWWPVDVSFFHRAFNSHMKCIKIPEKMYWWRQYAKQSTKIHERCSLERLRAAKVHYLLKEDGPLGFDALFPADDDKDKDDRDNNVDSSPASATEQKETSAKKPLPLPDTQKKLIIRVFGRGETLTSYIADINREIELLQAKDKKEYVQQAADNEYRPKLLYVVEKRDEMPGLPKRKRAKENLDKNTKLARLFAFGMAKARAKISRVVRDDFDAGGLDWFVA